MNPNVAKILTALEDQCNYPFASAQGFAYVNQQYFHPRFKPTYKYYFAPFKKYSHNTIYQIANIRPSLAKHLSDKMLKDSLNLMSEETCIAISHIFVAGITEGEANDLMDMGNEVNQMVLQRYRIQLFDSEDFQDVNDLDNPHRMGLTMQQANTQTFNFGLHDCELFEIPLQYPRNNILVFKLNII